jgi:hypothetical protein
MPFRPERQPNPQASDNWFEEQALRFLRSLQHPELMAQRDDFGLHGSALTKAGEQAIEHQ